MEDDSNPADALKDAAAAATLNQQV